MGRTLKTTHQIVLEEQQAFQDFKRALRREDKVIFDQLFAYMRLHITAISQANHALPLEAAFFAVLLEQQKLIARLQSQVNLLADGEENDKPSGLVFGRLSE